MWWVTSSFFLATALAATQRPNIKPTTKAPLTTTVDDYYDTEDETPIPTTSFSCKDKIDGFYADIETGCRVFHYCQTVQSAGIASETKDWAFVCPPTTIFRQQYLTCSPADGSFKCEDSEQYFNVNATEKPTTVPPTSSTLPPTNSSQSSQPPSTTAATTTSISSSATPVIPSSTPPAQTESTLHIDDSYLLPPLVSHFPYETFRPISVLNISQYFMPIEVVEHFKNQEFKPEFYIKGLKIDNVQFLDQYQKRISWLKKK